MKTTAAVLVETGSPLVLAELDIPPLKSGQSLVQIDYSGVCHTQVLECRGYRGEDRYLPHCLGHEAGGIVLETGEGVSKVKPGDRVILSWIKGIGKDVPGSVYQWDGRDVNAGGITTFSRHAVISENRLTLMPDFLSMKEAALLGCAVPTGVGAVLNTARARPGQSAALFGLGGVGLCAASAAAMSGCHPIIAVDILADKLSLAQALGATQIVDASKTNPVDEILSICPGGVDLTFEATGRPEVMVQALRCVRNQGGKAVVIGNAPYGEKITFDPRELNNGKQLLGTWGGDSVPDRDYPRYAKLIQAGKLNIEPLISRSYSLHEINQALDDLETGLVARPMIDMTGA